MRYAAIRSPHTFFIQEILSFRRFAGVEGIEPSLVALEANVLPLYDTPMNVDCT